MRQKIRKVGDWIRLERKLIYDETGRLIAVEARYGIIEEIL